MPINITYNGKPWLSATSTAPYTPQYETEKWKYASLYNLTKEDRENPKNTGLVREIPQGNVMYGLAVEHEDIIV